MSQPDVRTRASYYEWRYTGGGATIHALGKAGDYSAACGLSAWTNGAWLGTGSQAEYERAASLPRCKRCLKSIGGA